MHRMNEYLPTVPFDLYELHLLQLVARRGSFTAAARDVGLTQSAMTRQIQGVEARLGAALFERTTRRVEVTRAGAFLLRETSQLTGDLDALLKRFREEFTEAAKEVRVGVSKTISVAYLPGFFVAQQKRQPEVKLRVTHEPEAALWQRIEANEIDVGILARGRRLLSSLRVTHRFTDAFDLILPPQWSPPAESLRKRPARWREWLREQPWLLMEGASATGTQLRAWLGKRGWLRDDATEMDNFDLIINLVALGQGASLVPQRALAAYGRRRKVLRYAVPERFERELVVVARKRPPLPAHVEAFVGNILF